MNRSIPTWARFAVGTCLGLLLLGILTTGGPVGAESSRAGSVTVMAANDPGKTVESGSGADRFVLKLPVGAACPGDSLNDDYRIQSFIVPASDEPGTLQFEALKPSGEGRWALYNTFGSRWVQKGTSPNSGVGTPGLIDESPTLTMAFFQPGQLPSGDYRVGIACTLNARTERYWDARLILDADPSIASAEWRWMVTGQVPAGSSTRAPAWLVPAVASAVVFAVLLGLVLLLTERRRHRVDESLTPPSTSVVDPPEPTPSKEQS